MNTFSRIGLLLLLVFPGVTKAQDPIIKKEIDEAVLKYLAEPNDSIRAELFKPIITYYNDEKTRLYTGKKLKPILKTEVDNLFGTTLQSIDKIINYQEATAVVGNFDLKNRPYTKFIIVRDLNTSGIGIGADDKESYRKILLLLLFAQNPAEGLNGILGFYFTDDDHVRLFNRIWSNTEVRLIVQTLTNHKSSFVQYEKILKRGLTNCTGTSTGSNADIICHGKEILSASLWSQKACSRCNTIPFPLINSSYEVLSLIPDAERDSLLNHEKVAQIQSGLITFESTVLNLFKYKLLNGNDSREESLRTKYNNITQEIANSINAKYFPNSPVSVAEIKLSDLKNADLSGLMIHSLSFEFIQQWIDQNFSSRLPNRNLRAAIVEEGAADLATTLYQLILFRNKVGFNPNLTYSNLKITVDNLWKNNKLKSETGTIEETVQSELDKLIDLYDRNRIKEWTVKERTIDTQRYLMSEIIKIKRKWWFNKKLYIITEIPLKLRNNLQSNFPVFDVSGYSLINRKIDINIWQQDIFFNITDLINNDPFRCLPTLNNALFDKHYNTYFLEAEIQTKIGVEKEQCLNSFVGLKLGSQPPVNAHTFVDDMQNEVQSSDMPDKDKQNFINSLQSSTSIISRNYLNYLLKSNLDDQLNCFNSFYNNTIGYNVQIRLANEVYRRATGLPIQKDCKWYEAIWCNSKRNRAMNDARQRQIDLATRTRDNNISWLSKVPRFNILSISNTRSAIPFYFAFDSTSNTLMTFVRIHEDGGGIHYIRLHNPNIPSGKNLNRVNLFFTEYDPSYIARYNVDLSNISDHDFGYLADLTNAFIQENMTNQSIVATLSKNGFLKSYVLWPEDFGPNQLVAPFWSNLYIQSFLLENERKLIQKIKHTPIIKPDAIKAFNKMSESKNAEVNSKLVAPFNRINEAYNDAQKKWEEWSIFIGFTTVGNTTIPTVSYNGSGFSFTFPYIFNNFLPVIYIPSTF